MTTVKVADLVKQGTEPLLCRPLAGKADDKRPVLTPERPRAATRETDNLAALAQVTDEPF